MSRAKPARQFASAEPNRSRPKPKVGDPALPHPPAEHRTGNRQEPSGRAIVEKLIALGEFGYGGGVGGDHLDHHSGQLASAFPCEKMATKRTTQDLQRAAFGHKKKSQKEVRDEKKRQQSQGDSDFEPFPFKSNTVAVFAAARDPVLIPWLLARDVEVLLSLVRCCSQGQLNPTTFAQEMVRFRRAVSTHRKLVFEQFGVSDERMQERLEYGALLPPWPDDAGIDDEHWERLKEMPMAASRISGPAAGLITAARVIAPAGVDLCKEGWNVVILATKSWTRNRPGCPLELKQDSVLGKEWEVATGWGNWAPDYNAIRTTRNRLEKLNEMTDAALVERLIQRVLEVRPNTSSQVIRGAFNEACKLPSPTAEPSAAKAPQKSPYRPSDAFVCFRPTYLADGVQWALKGLRVK